jgi:hypothetical protein
MLAVGAVAAPTVAAAQGERCVFQVDKIGREGNRTEGPGGVNYFAGGGVRLRCQGTSVRMSSDSLASFGGRTVQFIGHVRYEDSTIIMTADRGTYYRDGERWEARGNVVTENRANGSTLKGPSLDYFRAVEQVRDTVEMYAVGRPTIRSVSVDSAGNRGEPYVIVADRVRMKGNDRTWAGGKVTVDRSDFSARGDSLYLDSGPANAGLLLGRPVMKGLGRDSFELRGRRIALTLENRAITYVKALAQGHAVSNQVDLVADTIGLDVDQQQLVQTIAWGDSIKPRALAADYEIRGDSLAFDTPKQVLREVRAFGAAFVGGKPDSVGGDRDWMTGDTIVADFASWDSAGVTRTALERLEARGAARSYYRVADQKQPAGLPSINYSRGNRITVRMKTEGRREVDRVDIQGAVDGIHLEPAAAPAPADTTRATGRPRGGRSR